LFPLYPVQLPILLLILCILDIVSSFITNPTHYFLTLDTVTDPEFAPLITGDWTQRLPEEVRKYKDQILSKMHMAHHEHKLSQKRLIVLKFKEYVNDFYFCLFLQN